MTLNQTWKNCLRMWKWIDKTWQLGMDIEALKEEWLNKYKPQLEIDSNCFFCDYEAQHNTNEILLCCKFCPGKLVSSRFSCMNKTYHYQNHPKKFYKKLLQLDAKRRQH
jgi:hypothetical protein